MKYYTKTNAFSFTTFMKPKRDSLPPDRFAPTMRVWTIFTVIMATLSPLKQIVSGKFQIPILIDNIIHTFFKLLLLFHITDLTLTLS